MKVFTHHILACCFCRHSTQCSKQEQWFWREVTREGKWPACPWRWWATL